MLLLIVFVILLSNSLQAQNKIEDDVGIHSKIVGGHNAALDAYPFMASLRIINSKSHFCGGTIIATKYILTAAHCITSVQPSEILVYVGTNTLSSGGTSYKVSKIIKHPNYNPTKIINDIALLQLSSNIKLSKTVTVVERSKCLNNNIKNTVTAVGWGSRSSRRPVASNTLQDVTLQTWPQTQCKNRWQDFGSNQICARFFFSGICRGDSGGPLLYKGKQIGISSYGSIIGCHTFIPDVYTNVCSYESWINSITKD